LRSSCSLELIISNHYIGKSTGIHTHRPIARAHRHYTRAVCALRRKPVVPRNLVRTNGDGDLKGSSEGFPASVHGADHVRVSFASGQSHMQPVTGGGTIAKQEQQKRRERASDGEESLAPGLSPVSDFSGLTGLGLSPVNSLGGALNNLTVNHIRIEFALRRVRHDLTGRRHFDQSV
jgi:hypothetical protein